MSTKRTIDTVPVATADQWSDAEAAREWRAFYRDVSPTQADVDQARALFSRLTKERRGE